MEKVTITTNPAAPLNGAAGYDKIPDAVKDYQITPSEALATIGRLESLIVKLDEFLYLADDFAKGYRIETNAEGARESHSRLCARRDALKARLDKINQELYGDFPVQAVFVNRKNEKMLVKIVVALPDGKCDEPHISETMAQFVCRYINAKSIEDVYTRTSYRIAVTDKSERIILHRIKNEKSTEE